MKIKPCLALVCCVQWIAYGQSTFIFDQQSINSIEGGRSLQSSAQPMGQSFTPTLSSVGFVMLNLYDGDALTNLGGTVAVNLRANSITGTILSSSLPVFIPDNFSGITNFLFSTPVAVTPGSIYCFQPVIQSGNPGIGSYVTDTSYAGTAYSQGSPQGFAELWFREGIVVPEPSAGLLAMFGGGVLAWRCRKR
jgi:hypothetical protein